MHIALAVAVSQGAVKELLACCKAAVSDAHLAAPAARALTAVLASDGARDEFAEQNGSMALKLLLDKSQGQAIHFLVDPPKKNLGTPHIFQIASAVNLRPC